MTIQQHNLYKGYTVKKEIFPSLGFALIAYNSSLIIRVFKCALYKKCEAHGIFWTIHQNNDPKDTGKASATFFNAHTEECS